MSSQTMTVNVPEPVFQHLKHRAAQSQRSVEEEMVNVLVTALPEINGLSHDLEAALSPLATLDDAGLWRAARSHLPSETAAQIEELHNKRQREGLTDSEAQTLTALIRHYERVMLVRAHAGAILRQRGHDVSGLVKSP